MKIKPPTLEELLRSSRDCYDENTIRWVYARFEDPIRMMEDRITDLETEKSLEALGLGDKPKEKSLWQKTIQLLSGSSTDTRK